MTRAGPFRVRVAPGSFPGSDLDPQRSIGFELDSKRFTGYAGDSLASALLANGVRTVSRSFKFHRPRGVYSCGPEEPNALLRLNRGAQVIPIATATLTQLREGLECFSLSGWPGVQFDLARGLDLVAPLWAAGFYNKTFIWPNWHVYEGMVRSMAGLGRAPGERDPDRYDTRNVHCEVLVIGAGVAGLREAHAAATNGARVILVEQSAQLGGRCAWDGSVIDGTPGAAWVNAMARRLQLLPDVQVLPRTTAAGYHDGGVVTLLEDVPDSENGTDRPRQRYWTVRASRVVLATGAIEQPLVFCNNDRPGIMLADAARQYLRRYGVAAGRRVVVATNNDSAYATARDLKEAGVTVVAVVDTRQEVSDALVADMRSLSIQLHTRSMPVDTTGFSALTGVKIARLPRDGESAEVVGTYACDALAVSGGWNPALHLYSQAGGKLLYDARSGALEAATPPANVRVAGDQFGETQTSSQRSADVGIRISPVGDTLRQWVDLRHDVTVADLELAVRENYTSIEHVKRYTTVGMSIDQGKTSTSAAIEIVAGLRGVPASAVGHTTQRPPFIPVTLGAIAGRTTGKRFAPWRRTPLHDWHVANGALLEDFGEWQRPAVYLRPGESRFEAMNREARAVRGHAGLFDASPLGKIEVHGPDAQDFIDRFYINNLMTLKPGRARYGLMLRESGVIFDDGTVVMIEPDRFILTTTSGNAARVGAWMEEWHQCEWPHMRVVIAPVTDEWATLSLTGPRAREILSRLHCDVDLAPAAFTHLQMREGRIAGSPARIYRVSFSGELTYEINVPADAGRALWEEIMQSGAGYGIQPLGLDALLLLRLEKGFLHVGTDTDGSSIPDDVGWGKVAADKPGDFIGKRSLRLAENQRTDRLQLVGLIGENGPGLTIGSHLRRTDCTSATDGWVTSAGKAVLTGESIGLALLRGGRQQIGTTVSIHDARSVTHARVVSPPFFDAKGDRMNA